MSLSDIMRQKLEKEAAEKAAARAVEEAKEEAERAAQEAQAPQSGCKYKDEPQHAHTLLHIRDQVADVLDTVVHGAKKHELPGDLDFDRSVLIDELRLIRDKLDAAVDKSRAISTALDVRQKKLEEKDSEPKCDDHPNGPGH